MLQIKSSSYPEGTIVKGLLVLEENMTKTNLYLSKDEVEALYSAINNIKADIAAFEIANETKLDPNWRPENWSSLDELGDSAEDYYTAE